MSKAGQISEDEDREIWYALREVGAIRLCDRNDKWRIKRDPRTRRRVSEALRERIRRLQELLDKWEAK